MKVRSLLLLFIPLLLLTGCASSKLAVLPDGWQEAGTVEYAVLSETFGIAPYVYGIYLPPAYDPEAGEVYPIVYFFPGFVGGRTDWFDVGIAQIADELILSRELPPFIIVTTEAVGDDLDAPVIVERLMPIVESRYPVSPERRYRAVAGCSWGGFAAYHVGFRFPERFASVGIFGGGTYQGDASRIRGWLSDLSSAERTRVFFNCGFEDELGTVELARSMIALLDEAGVAHAEIFGPGIHDMSYWARQLPDYFRWLAQDWR